MEKAFGRFGGGPLATDVETARYLLQQHQDIKKGIICRTISSVASSCPRGLHFSHSLFIYYDHFPWIY